MDKLRDEAIKLNNDDDFVKFLPDEVEDRLLKNSFIQVGFDDGIKQGIEQGIEKNTIELTRNMLKKNMDPDTISEITGLSLEKINQIKNDM